MTNKLFNKKVKPEFYSTTKRNKIWSAFSNPDTPITEISHVTIEVNIKDLQRLYKSINKRLRYFKKWSTKRKKQKLPDCRCYFDHLSPDVSFFIKY